MILHRLINFFKKEPTNDEIADEQFKIGYDYYTGKKILEQDFNKAVICFKKAAESGNKKAQYYLGICYKNGEGVDKDYTEASKWYEKAAEQGHVYAQYRLGNLLYNNKIFTEAATWYKKAAEQNLSEAQYCIGKCYFEGVGVIKDFTEAIKWYRKAAEQKHAQAQYNLAICYFEGIGFKRNIEEALKWTNKAADNGFEEAIQETLDANKENIFIPSDDIEKIKINKSTDSENAQDYYSMVIKTSKDKYKFNLQIDGAKERTIKIYCKENYSIKI